MRISIRMSRNDPAGLHPPLGGECWRFNTPCFPAGFIPPMGIYLKCGFAALILAIEASIRSKALSDANFRGRWPASVFET